MKKKKIEINIHNPFNMICESFRSFCLPLQVNLLNYTNRYQLYAKNVKTRRMFVLKLVLFAFLRVHGGIILHTMYCFSTLTPANVSGPFIVTMT